MKVSFIIPAYNVEAFLPRCLQSIAPLLDEGHEAVLIDDGSTDGTLVVAETFAREHPQLRVVSQPNSGQSAARNRALKMATGDYIFYLDADDYLHTIEVRQIIEDCKAAIMGGLTVDAVVFGLRLDNGSSSIASPILQRRTFATGLEYFRHTNCDGTFRTYPCNKMFSRQRLLEWNIVFPEGRIYEDMQFNLQFFAQCGTVLQMPLNPYHYVLYNPTSSTNPACLQQRDLQALISADEATEWLEKFNPKHDNKRLHAEDITFQTLLFSFLSSCLLKKYIPLSFKDEQAMEFVNRTLEHPLFKKAMHCCAKHPSIGIRRWGMAVCLCLSPRLSRYVINALM